MNIWSLTYLDVSDLKKINKKLYIIVICIFYSYIVNWTIYECNMKYFILILIYMNCLVNMFIVIENLIELRKLFNVEYGKKIG